MGCGNRTRERVVNAGNIAISDSTLAYNDRDQLTSRNDTLANVHLVQTWDDNGNLKTQTVNNGTPRVYSYDARDRMTGLNAGPGTALSFAYHPDGLRREKTSTNGTTRYHYDDQSLLAETNAIGNTVRQYHYSAEQLIAETKAGTTPVHRQYLLDALRSPIALLTQQGAVSARTSYDAFGEIRAQVGVGGGLVTPERDQANAELVSGDEQSFGFTGYVKDTESGLYYAKARYYDPATARFNTEDPEAGKDMEPPSLHRYLYAYANPAIYVDPDGRQACRGHEVDNCPLKQWTSPNRPIPQTIASDALRGDPQLAEVDADRAFALPSASLTSDQHINTQLYRLVPNVDPDGDGKAVRFYSAQNRETGQFDWTVPPAALDNFVTHESFQMNTAAYSRIAGGATPSNIEVQRANREIANGNPAGAISHLGQSWGAALKDPLFYLNVFGNLAGGAAAKTAGPARAMTIAEGSGGHRVVQSASTTTSQAVPRPMPGDPGFVGPLTKLESKILFGEPKPGTNNIIGAHSPEVLNSSKYQYQSKTTNPDGTISLTQFKGEIVRKDGSIGMSKSKPTNTVAPSSWSNGDVLRAGETTANVPGTILRNENGVVTTSHLEVVNGVQWQVLKEDGVVTSSFPTGGRPVQ